MKLSEAVPAALAGERLDRVVAMIAGVSRAVASAVIDAGGARCNGQVCTARSQRLEVGDQLEIDVPDIGEDVPLAEPDVAFTVVHEDPDVVVVDKPPGLVVHPGSGNRRGTLVGGLLARFPEIVDVGERQRPGIVHRLDKGTSGLLVVARTPASYEALVAALAQRRVERRYVALVWGEPAAPRGLVDAPIGRSSRDPTRMAVAASGRDARTGYEVVRTFARPARATLLHCHLETGRTHQIRVHLASIGHPVVGDERYGGAREAIGCARPFLHAAELAFTHPVTGEELRFSSPLADDLAAVLSSLS